MKLYDLRTDSRKTPLGTDERSPAFSWKIASDKQNTFQESYHIIAVSYTHLFDYVTSSETHNYNDGHDVHRKNFLF